MGDVEREGVTSKPAKRERENFVYIHMYVEMSLERQGASCVHICREAMI